MTDRPADDEQERLEQAVRAYAGEFLLLVDREGTIRVRLGAGTLGYGDQRTGHHILDLVHPDDLPRALEALERARRSPRAELTTQVRAKHLDGSWRLLEAKVWNRGDDLGGAVLRIRDVTELQPASEGDDRFSSLADALPSGVLTADSLGMVVFANDAAVELFDMEADALCQRGWQQVVSPEDMPEVAQAASTVLTHVPRSEVTFRARLRDAERWLHAKFVPVSTAGRRTGWLGMFDDVTARREEESSLAHRATHDALTGLPNRALLEDRLSQATSRLRRHPQPLTVVFVDLDGFKAVNDRLGHAAGDKLLAEVAGRLTTAVRPSDTVARLGGDEFAIVCEALSERAMDELDDRIRQAVCVPMLLDGQAVAVDVSLGIASTDDPSTEGSTLLSRADQAMYRDKRSHQADAGYEAGHGSEQAAEK